MPHRGLLCLSIGAQTQTETLDLIDRFGSAADIIEIRLDFLENPDPQPFLQRSCPPLLFTNRPDWEGGHFRGPEAARIQPLLKAAAAGAAYIDCELRAPEQSRRLLREATAAAGGRLLFSWHDFLHTPAWPELRAVLQQMRQAGCDVGKIVTMAHSQLDVLRTLRLLAEAITNSFPLAAFCMGQPGMISRLATVELGGYMTYCSVPGAVATASGQLDIEQARVILDQFADAPRAPIERDHEH
jgi:3-dehydroquinate dehydratase-1/3-dehydroquinate dehydratase/shikimate dehydrogenase